MQRACCVLLILLSAALCQSQANPSLPAADLSTFSSKQLSACFNDKTVCHTDDASDIADELASRLPQFSTDQLVACFADWHICGASDSQATGWQISDELAARGEPRSLLARYFQEPNMMIRNGIVHIAYHFDTPEVTAFMRKVLVEHRGDGEDRYWPANYLAKKCDPLGLKWLRTGVGRNQGSLQYQTTLPIFGKCGYRPSIPMLVDDGLFDFSLNIVGGAEQSLNLLYPDSPRKFTSIEEEQKYYCHRARAEGFKMRCKTH